MSFHIAEDSGWSAVSSTRLTELHIMKYWFFFELHRSEGPERQAPLLVESTEWEAEVAS